MSLESNIEWIAQSLAIIATKMNTGAMAQAEFVSGGVSDAVEKTEGKKPGRPKKGEAPATEQGHAALPGDPEGTRYWLNEVDGSFFAEKPGMAGPAEQSFKICSPAAYAAAKEAAAKKSGATATPTTPAATSPSTAGASTASSSTASGQVELTFDMVLKKFTELSTDSREGRGRDGIVWAMAKINKDKGFNPAVGRLTELQGKVDNAVLYAMVVDLLANGIPKEAPGGAAADLF